MKITCKHLLLAVGMQVVCCSLVVAGNNNTELRAPSIEERIKAIIDELANNQQHHKAQTQPATTNNPPPEKTRHNVSTPAGIKPKSQIVYSNSDAKTQSELAEFLRSCLESELNKPTAEQIEHMQLLNALKGSMQPDQVKVIRDAISHKKPFVVMFKDCDYLGDAKISAFSEHEMDFLWRKNLSAVRLYNGAKIKLYSEKGLRGKYRFLLEDEACLINQDFNDQAKSYQLISTE